MAEAATALMTITNLKLSWWPALSRTTARWLSSVILLRSTNRRDPRGGVCACLPALRKASALFWWVQDLCSVILRPRSKISTCPHAIWLTMKPIQHLLSKVCVDSILPLCLWLSKWIINVYSWRQPWNSWLAPEGDTFPFSYPAG